MHEDQKQHVVRALSQDMRYDGRKKLEYRAIEVESDVSNTAEGSARVKIGDTEVIAGVKMSIETPYPDTPDQGNLMVGAELLPLSSNEFEPGPPAIDAIELARVMDRSVRESGAMDIKKLCIKKGEQVWTISCDLCTINDAGNLFDASSLAILTALLHTKFPEVKDGVVDYKTKSKKKLPLDKQPLAITVWKVGDQVFCDPLRKEEQVCDARLTVGTTEDGKICALQKGGDGPLKAEDIDAMLTLALEKSKELRKQVKA